MPLPIECNAFGLTAEGLSVDRFVLRNNNQLEISIINYGGIVTSFNVPDQAGNTADIVLGYASLQQYESCEIYMGCIVGRYANRIANAEFLLDGTRYSLEANNGCHHLHGGSDGFHRVVWDATVEEGHHTSPQRLLLSHVSKDGQGGYPGTLQVQVAYSLTDSNEFIIEYTATTDKETVVNLTSHGYFNLKGHQHASSGGVLDHQLQLLAGQYLPTDATGIPLLAAADVAGTPMDFTTAAAITEKFNGDYSQTPDGYDHNWVVGTADDPWRGDRVRLVASVKDPGSGRQLDVVTSQPGIQFYTANHVHDCAGKQGARYQKHGALCLETQHFPDSPNRPDFPATVLRPGETLSETTIYRVASQGRMMKSSPA